MFEGHDRIVFDLLSVHPLVNATRLREAFDEGSRDDESFAARVVAQHLVETPELLRIIADHLNWSCATELPDELSSDVVALITGDLARDYGVAPWTSEVGSVSVFAVDPFNPSLVSDLAFALGRDVHIVVADPAGVRGLIRKHYGEVETSIEDALHGLQAHHRGEIDESALTDGDIERLAGQSPVIRFVNLVLAQAIRDHASDIHFEPFEHEFKIRYRIDGSLYEMAPPPRHLALPILSRIKILANLNIAERRLPQDGRITLTVGGRAVDLRVSTLPTQFGESIVLRVLDQSVDRLDLAQIGMPEAIQRDVEEIIRRPNGIFIVTGPTGSGKTTTLYSCLKQLNAVGSKLLTVEDPVEYAIDGVMQVPVNPAAGLGFARALRTFLRQDPDIVMVGEIRDFETAQIAIQASLTGHLVLTTLHTNDAASTVTRLTDMGIEPFMLASTLEAVLAQRLLRRICSACKTAIPLSDGARRALGADEITLRNATCYHGAGCEACHHTGYRGRIGIFELLKMTDPLRELVVQGASLVSIRQHAIEAGTPSLRATGIQAMLTGDTTLEEVIKYT